MKTENTPSNAMQGTATDTPAKRKRKNRFETRSQIPSRIKPTKGVLAYAQELDTAAYMYYRDRGAFTGGEVVRWKRFFVGALMTMERNWPGSYREWSRRNRVILPFGTLDEASDRIDTMLKGGAKL